MASKRFKKLPEKTKDLPSQNVEKLFPIIKSSSQILMSVT